MELAFHTDHIYTNDGEGTTVTVGEHILLLDMDGKVWAAGRNPSGQLGNDVDSSNTILPVVMENGDQLGNVVSITTGDGSSAAIVKTVEGDTYYDLYTWGENNKGQAGLGEAGSQTSAVRHPTLAAEVDRTDADHRNGDTLMISGGFNHLMTARRDGSMWSAGGNWFGQLGNVSRNDSNEFVLVGQQDVLVTPAIIYVAVGQTKDLYQELTVTFGSGVNLLLLSVGGSTVWHGSNNDETNTYFEVDSTNHLTGKQAGTGIINIVVDSKVVAHVQVVIRAGDVVATPAIATGKDHILALKEDGTVWSWGENTYGQLGRTTLEEIGQVCYPGWDPSDPDTFDPAAKIAAADGVSFIITQSGRAYAFGSNTNDRLGIGFDTLQTVVPTEMKDNAGAPVVLASDITVGETYTYLLTTSLTTGKSLIYAYGEEYKTPQAIAQVDNAVQLAGHYLRTASGKVWEITVGTTMATPVTGFTDTPDDVSSELDIIKIAASGTHWDCLGHG